MGFAVHVGALVFMNQVLFTSAAMLLVFFDWVAIGARVRRLAGISRLMDWWENFSAPPEFFPGVVLAAPPNDGGLLLWDGDCGFCRRMVEWLRAFSLRPVAMRPYQEIPRIPPEVLPWVDRQMHWVRADGSICGGSQALIETLEAGYHNLIAGALESPPLRPFTWLAYRLVAGHRGVAGKFVGAACELPK